MRTNMPKRKGTIKVYLAGDMRSGWQDRITKLLPKTIKISDPRKKPKEYEKTPALYTQWDLSEIRKADIVLAYMCGSNPSGFGLSLELGYACALGKTIIFLDAIKKDFRSGYFGMARSVSTTIVHTFKDAAQEIINGVRQA